MNFPEFPVVDVAAVGKRIRELRKEHNYRVEDIAEYMSFSSPQAVYKWQRGDSLPTVNNLLALSSLFGTTVDYILKGNDRGEDGRSSPLPFYRDHFLLKNRICSSRLMLSGTWLGTLPAFFDDDRLRLSLI